MLLVASETGHVYTFATKKLQPMITSEEGKSLIQTCLNSPGESHEAVASAFDFVPPSYLLFPHLAYVGCGLDRDSDMVFFFAAWTLDIGH